MKFNLLEYEVFVSYNPERYYPFEVNLIDLRGHKDVFYGYCIDLEQTLRVIHRELLFCVGDTYPPIYISHSVEKLRGDIKQWVCEEHKKYEE